MRISTPSARDFSGDAVGRTPFSQCKGSGYDPWSVHKISHVASKNFHSTTKTEAPCVRQLRSSAAK